MIDPFPKLRDLPIEVLVMGGLGFGYGVAAKINPMLSTCAAVAYCVADQGLYYTVSKINASSSKTISRRDYYHIYTITSTVVNIVTTVACRNLELISTTGIFVCSSITTYLFVKRLYQALRHNSTVSK